MSVIYEHFLALADTQNRTNRLDKLIALMETQARYMRPVTVAKTDPGKSEKDANAPGSSLVTSTSSLRLLLTVSFV